MERIAVVGNKETILIFKSLGVDVFETTNGEELLVLRDVLKKEFKIIFVTDNVYEICKEEIKKYIYNSSIVITVIPSAMETKSIGIKELRKATIEAISTDILGE